MSRHRKTRPLAPLPRYLITTYWFTNVTPRSLARFRLVVSLRHGGTWDQLQGCGAVPLQYLTTTSHISSQLRPWIGTMSGLPESFLSAGGCSLSVSAHITSLLGEVLAGMRAAAEREIVDGILPERCRGALLRHAKQGVLPRPPDGLVWSLQGTPKLLLGESVALQNLLASLYSVPQLQQIAGKGRYLAGWAAAVRQGCARCGLIAIVREAVPIR